MNSRDFAFWLQGYFEISGGGELNQTQVGMIRNHLALVFAHEIDPSMEPSVGVKNELDAIHAGVEKAQKTANAALNRINRDPLIRC